MLGHIYWESLCIIENGNYFTTTNDHVDIKGCDGQEGVGV